MDVALFPALSAPAAPAAGDIRAAQSGEAIQTAGPFGSALASALGQADPAEKARALTGDADRGGGAASDEARLFGADDSSQATVASALLGFLGFVWDQPLPPALPPALPDGGAALVGLGAPDTTPSADACPAPEFAPIATLPDGLSEAVPDKVDGQPTPDSSGLADLNADARTNAAPGRLAAPSPAETAAPAEATTPGAGGNAAQSTDAAESTGQLAPAVPGAPDRTDSAHAGARRRPPGAHVDHTAPPPAAAASQGPSRSAAAHQAEALDLPPANTPEAQPTPQAGPADAGQNGPAVQADTWFARAYHGRDTTVDETAAAAGLLVREAVGAVARANADGTARGREDAPDKGPAKHAAPSLAAAYGAGRPAVPDLSARAFDLANAALPQDAADPATANGEPLEHAIVKSLKLQWNQGIGEARLQLKPEYLGELSVALRVHGSSVTAVLQSDSPAVRAWVEHHQGELRRALEDAGLSLDSLVIDADGHARDQKEQSAPDERRQQPGRKPVPPGRFEALL